jgi:fatty acid desaturase
MARNTAINKKIKKIVLSPSVVKDLSIINPLKGCATILFHWILIIGAIFLSQHFQYLWLYIITVMWIGARQHALAILMHEGAHSRLLKNKFWNDAIADIVLAWPIFVSLKSYRRNHLAS